MIDPLLALRSEGIAILPDLRFPEGIQSLKHGKGMHFKRKDRIIHDGWKEFLPVVTEYYGHAPKTVEGELIHSWPSAEPESHSQLWHRDWHSGDKCVRAFIYLTDVDENSGPLQYAHGSHVGGWRDPKILVRQAECPVDSWMTLTGPKGTTILFDIMGYHRGLRNISGERKVLCFSYYGHHGQVTQ